MKKKILLIVAFVASVFASVHAQVSNGNTTTPLTGEKTWDFSSFENLPEGITTACTIDNLYFGVTASAPMCLDSQYSRLVLGVSADQSALSDASTDCVLSFKVPAGEGTLVVTGKSAAKARPGIVFVGNKAFREQGDSINSVQDVSENSYTVKTDKETSVYIVAENAKLGKPVRKSKGLFIYKITWTPKASTAVNQVEVQETHAVSEYYNALGMRVTAPKKGALLKKGKNGKMIVLE